MRIRAAVGLPGAAPHDGWGLDAGRQTFIRRSAGLAADMDGGLPSIAGRGRPGNGHSGTSGGLVEFAKTAPAVLMGDANGGWSFGSPLARWCSRGWDVDFQEAVF